MEIFLNHIRFRCCIGCRDMFLSNNGFDRSDQANLISCIFKDRLHHVSGGCLTLGSRDSDRFQFLRRMSEPCCGNKRHGITGIFHLDHSYICRSFHRFFYDESFCTFCHNIRHEFMAVHNCASDADKKTSLFYFTGIIHNRRNFLVCISLKAFVFKMF